MPRRLQQEMPRLGFEPHTPPDTASALPCFGLNGRDYRPLLARLAQRKVHARIGTNYLRVSPSVFGDLADADRLPDNLGQHLG